MTVPGEITLMNVVGELHRCPACGYERGFHTSFISMNADKDNPVKSTREVWRVILLCPECGARFDVGWRVSFAEFESRFVKASVVPPVPQKSTVVTCVPALPPHDPSPPE
jgi:predicted RNA-binding Zn-ribbon protein involved in translation (DUF1610 family)